ncbi:MAG: foldase protein PrsA [Candidatus Berkelbacteria bacterium Athens1014_28]|uniref:Foldase protein PrsA n=1 Tax=Candidatus Berkelbacteria bacterium Athens1014_28 TaxID=2017145 RepID=A0A554LKR5_9BACT|nr:MAG: foldase protein PrsA [Candidatus Berkelbacteria bacterium Athens1014_28]
MNKIKTFFVLIWLKIKQAASATKSFVIFIFVLIRKARNGEALELHPLVGIWANMALKVILGFAVLVYAVIVAFGIGIYKYKLIDNVTINVAKVVPFPVAVVQGRIVYASDYFKNYKYINRFYEKTQQSGVDQATLKEKIISQLIDTELLRSQAKKYGVSVLASDINDAYSEVVVQNGGEEEVSKVLSDLYGLSIKDFKELIADQILEQKLRDSVPIQIKAQHILIRLDAGADEKTTTAAKTKIDQILGEVKAGADFSAIANKYSEDTGSNQNGGDLGFFSRGQMDSDFEKTAFSTPVGQVSEPIKTQFGWHIIKVNDKKGSVDKSFADWLLELRSQSLVLQLLKS